MNFCRPHLRLLMQRLDEVPQRLIILSGPRQVGKTTLTRQLQERRPGGSSLYCSADDGAYPSSSSGPVYAVAASNSTRRKDQAWLIEQWELAQKLNHRWCTYQPDYALTLPFVLVIDEIQHVPNWSAVVKGLWDQQRGAEPPMHVLLLGSSPLLMQRGLTESLAGRFELVRMTHWSFEEMAEAFGFSLDQYLFFGGYPGSASMIADEDRWRGYIDASLIRPNIDKDILQMTRVEKPPLLKQLFELGCLYSGQIVALDKMLGQLRDAGNTTTLAKYLDLLGDAGLLIGLQKIADQAIRQRRSPPKFQALNSAFVSALGTHSFEEAQADRSHWGRLVESAIGAHLCNTSEPSCRVHYWREGSNEVDFVIEHRGRLAAIEVKTGKLIGARRGMHAFAQGRAGLRTHVVGGPELPIAEFLRFPASHWV